MSDESLEKPKRVLVTPGEILSSDPSLVPGRGAIRDGDDIISIFMGLKNVHGKYVNVVPLNGLYDPQMGDKIIGLIVDKTPTKWIVDINAKTLALLSPKEAMNKNESDSYRSQKVGTYKVEKKNRLDKYVVGDYIICKIIAGDRLNTPKLTTLGQNLGEITEGVVIEISPPKIPRVIGRRASMVSVLKKLLDCKIFIAQNGRIWIKGKSLIHEDLLMEIIEKIEYESHTTGLTNRITYTILEKRKERGI